MSGIDFTGRTVLVTGAGRGLGAAHARAVAARGAEAGLDAPVHLTRAAFPLMKRQGYGRFVFTTSAVDLVRAPVTPDVMEAPWPELAGEVA